MYTSSCRYTWYISYFLLFLSRIFLSSNRLFSPPPSSTSFFCLPLDPFLCLTYGVCLALFLSHIFGCLVIFCDLPAIVFRPRVLVVFDSRSFFFFSRLAAPMYVFVLPFLFLFCVVCCECFLFRIIVVFWSCIPGIHYRVLCFVSRVFFFFFFLKFVLVFFLLLPFCCVRRLGSQGANGKLSSQGRAQKGSVLVTGKFVGSLGSLMAAISETEPHYIRCVKPNEDQLPMSFQARWKSICFVE